MSKALELARRLLGECQQEHQCEANYVLRNAAAELIRLAAIEKLARAVAKNSPYTIASMKRLHAALNTK